MQKIILDTNVVVSALIAVSYPHCIVYERVLAGMVQLCLSQELYDEYCAVTARPKFAAMPHFIENAEIVLTRMRDIALFYSPQVRLQIIKDASDNKLLELAHASHADFLITGNSIDFTIECYGCTRILSPHAYWQTTERVF